MRWTRLFFATYKDVPNDAVVVSHQLLHRAGFIIKSGVGLFSYSPLMMRVISKTETIIREELNKADCLEIAMPVVTPAGLWQESGRWDDMGPLMLRFSDRADRQLCISPTNEEAVVDYFRTLAKSYKQLPCNLYQINTKFRDEIRPRFGLMRAREFSMKDGYSFHANKDCLDNTYDKMFEAYTAIFKRIGLNFISVEADGGDMAGAGAKTHEFQVIADSGEDDVVVCQEEGYASNREAAVTKRPALLFNRGTDLLKKVETPDKKSIEAVSDFLKIEAHHCLKAYVYVLTQNLTKNNQTSFVMALCLGDDTFNELKLKKHITGSLTPATDDELKNAGFIQGFMGPVHCPKNTLIIVDNEVDEQALYCCGANEIDAHFMFMSLSRDCAGAYIKADIRLSKEGDVSMHGGQIDFKRGIEVGHIFQLGDKYTKSLRASVLDENGKEIYPLMGCYGIGVGRTIASAIEQKHDDKGIVWPKAIAPFEVLIIIMSMKDDLLVTAAEELYLSLKEQSIDVAMDDREVSAGVKFKDADLIGIPFQIIVGKTYKEEAKFECVVRETGDKYKLNKDELLGRLRV
jgi:prolyl-tRNA synthetase